MPVITGCHGDMCLLAIVAIYHNGIFEDGLELLSQASMKDMSIIGQFAEGPQDEIL